MSRLSRSGGPGAGPVGTAVAAEAVQLPGGTVLHPKAMAASLQSQALAGRGAVDAFQQQDQGLGRQRSGTAGFRSSSEPQSPSGGGTSGDYRDSSVEGQPGSSISPISGPAGCMSSQQQQQQGVGQGHAVTAGRSPAAAAAAAAAAGSPSAGLATLMQALDTTGNGTGSAGQGGSGHVPSSCGQQQAAAMMDM